ncbi:MAG TPA: hypothetical protein VGG83_24375 [Trebonia sp.]
MRKAVVAGLAVVVLAAGIGTVVWREQSGTSRPAAAATASMEDFPVADDLSCASATTCLAVGSNIHGATGMTVPVALALEGGTWRPVTVTSPVRPGRPGRPSALLGVSCPTARYCLAVGVYNAAASGDARPYALAWNGAELSPVAGLSLPDGTDLSGIAVSCPAANRCLVLEDVSGGVNGELVETWNGTRWSATAVPMPTTAQMEDLGQIQCSTLTDCVADGGEGIDDGDTIPVVDTWNGSSFTQVRPPAPPGMSTAEFDGLSCAARNRCVAVGDGYAADHSRITSFLDVWNGRTWKLSGWRGAPGSGDARLTAVSCRSAADCVAVGSDGDDTSPRAAALAWNGRRWTPMTVPGPGAGRLSAFYGVDCRPAGCTAIGETGRAGATIVSLTDATPIAVRWNGRNGRGWQVTAS